MQQLIELYSYAYAYTAIVSLMFLVASFLTPTLFCVNHSLQYTHTHIITIVNSTELKAIYIIYSGCFWVEIFILNTVHLELILLYFTKLQNPLFI